MGARHYVTVVYPRTGRLGEGKGHLPIRFAEPGFSGSYLVSLNSVPVAFLESDLQIHSVE